MTMLLRIKYPKVSAAAAITLQKRVPALAASEDYVISKSGIPYFFKGSKDSSLPILSNGGN